MSVSVMIQELFKAFGNTVLIFVLTLAGSLPLGLIVYFGRKSRIGIILGIVKVYISIMRGTPLMLQLMMVFYGPSLLIPLLFPGVKFSLPSNWRFTAVIIAFVINYAAYFCEIFRGGIESIPKGQYEAADVLGLTKSQTFFRIILPQMVKRVIPPVTNEVITLVKDTSLSSAIGTVEMFTKAKQIAVAPKSPGMLTFVAAAVFYYVFNYAVAFLMERIEKKLDYYR